MTRVRKADPFLTVTIWRWGLLAMLVLLWEIGSRAGWIDRFFFSSPTEIWQTAVIKWRSGQLMRDIGYTAASTLLGFVLGTGVGSVIGLMFWFSRRVALVAEPWLIVLNALPKLALAPVLVIWFGIGFSSTVASSLAAARAFMRSSLASWLRRRFRYAFFSGWAATSSRS